MVVMLPWTAVTKGASVILPSGRRALVTAAHPPVGSVREVTIDGRDARVFDAGALVPVVFDELSQALGILASIFDVQLIGET